MIRQKGQMSSGFHAMGSCRSLCAAIMKEVMVEVEVNEEVRSGLGVGTSSLFRARSCSESAVGYGPQHTFVISRPHTDS
jgi:hypothetical protein